MTLRQWLEENLPKELKLKFPTDIPDFPPMVRPAKATVVKDVVVAREFSPERLAMSFIQIVIDFESIDSTTLTNLIYECVVEYYKAIGCDRFEKMPPSSLEFAVAISYQGSRTHLAACGIRPAEPKRLYIHAM